jgi:putative heme-binding domain-containing protein
MENPGIENPSRLLNATAMPHTHRRTVWLLALCLVGGPIAPGRAADDPPRHPHPILAWPSGPFELKVAFAQPLDPAVASRAVGRLVPFEEEASVTHQGKPIEHEDVPAHHGTIRIAAARLENDGRSLVLVTDPHPRVATYSLHLVGIRGPGQPEPGEAIDLLYGLGGVEAVWDEGAATSRPAWSGWWPDLDPGIVRRLTQGSVEHQRALALLSRPGRLVLNTLFVLPKGRFTLRLVSNGPIEATVGGENAPAVELPQVGHKVDYPVESTGEPIDLSITLRTGTDTKPTTLRASYLKQEDNARDIRLAHERLLVPWATTTPSLPVNPPTLPRDMAGGDPARGETVFFGEQARCSACHAIGKKGGIVGPDLGRQFERPPAEVFRDLAEPGAWINPNFVAYTVALKDGRIFVGIVRAEGADSIRITDTDARSTLVRRDEIDEFRPSATSIMPVGLAGTLGENSLRDLLAFLTCPPAVRSR